MSFTNKKRTELWQFGLKSPHGLHVEVPLMSLQGQHPVSGMRDIHLEGFRMIKIKYIPLNDLKMT